MVKKNLAKGTRDLDVNVFVDPTKASEVLSALPDPVTVTDADIATATRDGQVRVWWEDTPIDVFLDIHRFHAEVADGVRSVPFEGRTIPVLDCTALAVFTALFDRTKDWADIEEIVAAGALELPRAVMWLERILGSNSPAVERLKAVALHPSRRPRVGVARSADGLSASESTGEPVARPPS